MQKYVFHDREYYLAADIYKYEPESFVGCSKNARQIIARKDVPAEHYVYATFIKSKQVWEIKDPKYNLAKPFLTVEWARANLTKLKEPEEKTEADLKIEALKAPSLVVLEEEEMFRDARGNAVEIEVRGSRETKELYFKLSDAEKAFQLTNIYATLARDGWLEGLHYTRFFIGTNLNKGHILPNGNRVTIYLTFKGMLKYLYSSRSPAAEAFQDWAEKILFTHKFGAQEEKLELAAEMLSINARNLKAVLDRSATAVPAVYLFRLRENMYKFGCTTDLKRRAREHSKKYGAADLELFAYIDPKYVFDAETGIKQLCSRLGRAIEQEVVEIEPKDFKLIRDHFKAAAAQYSGNTADLQRELEQSTQKLREAQMAAAAANLQKELDLAKKDLEIAAAKSETELLRKDLEIAALKIKLLER